MRTAAAATRTMTQLWHSLTCHGLVFRATPGVSCHISGTDSVHGEKNRTRFFFFLFLITAALLSVCRMWCHHSDAFRDASVLTVIIIYAPKHGQPFVLLFSTRLSLSVSMLICHFLTHSNFHTTSSRSSSPVWTSSSCLICTQGPSTWSTSCLMIMCFTCWSPCTARRGPTTSWGPWRERAAQVRPIINVVCQEMKLQKKKIVSLGMSENYVLLFVLIVEVLFSRRNHKHLVVRVHEFAIFLGFMW